VDDLIRLMKTLADPTRLTLFKLILTDELCVCELQSLLGISQPAVSQHMAKLKAAGLVRERRAGSWTYYKGDLAEVTARLGAVSAFLAADPGDLPEIADLAQKCKCMDRVGMCGPETKGVVIE